MRKIPTLFKRDPKDMRKLLPEVSEGCQWVLDGEGVPTRKYDGTCCMYDPEGLWWARREVKAGATAPGSFVLAEFDDVTRKSVGWEPMEQSGFAKWHRQALESEWDGRPGTYELCGPKVQGNPEGFEHHVLVRHADARVLDDVPAVLSCETLRDYLREFRYEGIVWHHPDGRMAKLKRRDFPS